MKAARRGWLLPDSGQNSPTRVHCSQRADGSCPTAAPRSQRSRQAWHEPAARGVSPQHLRSAARHGLRLPVRTSPFSRQSGTLGSGTPRGRPAACCTEPVRGPCPQAPSAAPPNPASGESRSCGPKAVLFGTPIGANAERGQRRARPGSLGPRRRQSIQKASPGWRSGAAGSRIRLGEEEKSAAVHKHHSNSKPVTAQHRGTSAATQPGAIGHERSDRVQVFPAPRTLQAR